MMKKSETGVMPGMSDRLSKSWDSPYFKYKDIFSMLLPLIADQFFVSVINLLTTAMISSSSQESVSAVSLVSPIYMMIYAVFSAISSGGAVIIAQYKGRGDMEKLRRSAVIIVIASTAAAVILAAIMAVAARPLIGAMFAGSDKIIIEKASDYLIGCSISFIFLAVYMGAFAVFRGIGKTGICLKLSMIINLIHLFASLIFINGLGMDIFGTILSLNIARVIGGIIAIYYLLKPSSGINISLRDFRKPDLSFIKPVITISTPFALEQLCFNGGGIISSIYIAGFGTSQVAANAVTGTAIAIFYAMGMAVSNLAVTVVGQCTGAGDTEWVRKYGRKLVWLGEFAVLLSIAVFLPLLKFILMLYGAPENTLGQIYTLMFITLPALGVFWSLSNVLPNVMRAAGDVNFTSAVSLITMWIVRVGFGYILSVSLGMGITGVWLCVGLEYIVRSVIFVIRFHSTSWLKHLKTD